MRIDSALNLVFPVRSHIVESKDADGKLTRETVVDVWAYHSPISREVFEANYRIIAAAKRAIQVDGGYDGDAPLIAGLALRDAAKLDAMKYGVDEDGNTADVALMAEIQLRTHVLVPGARGYELLPAEVAISTKRIDEDEWAEAESAICFFTVASSILKRADKERISNVLARALRGSITSSTPTAFRDSLPTSTAAATLETAPEVLKAVGLAVPLAGAEGSSVPV
jgi:hypothetical protein